VKKTLAVLAGVMLAVTVAAAQPPASQFREVKDKAPQTRTLTGMVSNQHGNPLSD